MGKPIEDFFYRLHLFDENNELEFFKIFRQSCCGRDDDNDRVWWKLSTHKLQFGEYTPTIYDHPRGFIGEHVRVWNNEYRQYVIDQENQLRMANATPNRQRQEESCTIS